MGFITTAAKATEPHVVELTMTLEDGERAAVKCRPLISIDYFSMPNGVNSAIPILTGSTISETMDPSERMKLYMWMREVVKKAVIAVRDVTEDGQSVWRPVVVVDDDLAAPEPMSDDDQRLKVPLRLLENLNGGEIVDVANAIITHTNSSKQMEAAKRKRPR